ncbi:MAG: SGNH/GDSL hydrolase family protein [Chloroflexota bacterium]
MPRLLTHLLTASFGMALALVLLELGSRLLPTPFEGDSNPADTAWDPTGWRGKPNYQTTVATDDYTHDLTLNSAGMHDTEHSLAKPANTFRILMLGDSFVQAVQVREPETAHQVLEDALNSRGASPPVEVVSAGVGGWGTGQQLQYFRREGRRYQPDLVLLMFFLGNDVKDNLPGRGVTVAGINHYAPYFVLAGHRLDPDPWLYAPGLEPVIGPASTGRKRVNDILGNIYRRSRLYQQLEPLVAAGPVQASMLDFYLRRSDTFDYALVLTYALAGQLHQEVTLDGAAFGVVLISPIDLIEFSRMSQAEREAVYQKFPGMRRAEEIESPNRQIAAHLAGQGIEVLDLLPVFIQAVEDSGEKLHFEGDKHWTAAGNRLAGETIAGWVLQTFELE